MAQQPNEFPQLTTKDVCGKMGLSPVSGSYERALCNYLGIFSPTVNGSWIQTLYPALVTIFDQLAAQTYSGVTISQYTIIPDGFDINPPYTTNGWYAYAYEANGFYPGLSSMGLYQYDSSVFDFRFVPTHIISWLSDQFLLYCQTAAGDDLQTQTIATNTAADASLAATVAAQGSSITTLQGQVGSAPSYNNAPGRTLNTSVQISTTKRTRVSYTVSVTTALTLLNLASAGQVFLEISANNSTWTTINSAGTTKSVALGLALNEVQYFNVQGEVPVGYYVRLRTTSSGGGSLAFVSGQEVLY